MTLTFKLAFYPDLFIWQANKESTKPDNEENEKHGMDHQEMQSQFMSFPSSGEQTTAYKNLLEK